MIRALRSTGGQVLTFDAAARKEVPARDTLRKRRRRAQPVQGPAGSYTAAVTTESREITRSFLLRLDADNIDVEIGGRAAPAPSVAPTQSAPEPSKTLRTQESAPAPASKPAASVRPDSAPTWEPPARSRQLQTLRTRRRSIPMQQQHDHIGRQKPGAR